MLTLRKIFMFELLKITSHLGINPRKGGKPPSDSSPIKISILVFFLLKQLTWAVDLTLRGANKMYKVIKIMV